MKEKEFFQLVEEGKYSANIDVNASVLLIRRLDTLDESMNGLKDSIVKSSDNADKLGKRVFWLNVILVAATVVGAFATVLMVLSKL